jgi:hypothetical protein
MPLEMVNLREIFLKISCLFGSTFICEHAFSLMKTIKSKSRTRLTDSHLESTLKIATTNIKIDIEQLSKEKQCQISH